MTDAGERPGARRLPRAPRRSAATPASDLSPPLTSACRRATVRSATAAASSLSRRRHDGHLLRCPPGGPREPHSHPAQPPPVYNDWDRTGRAGPARTRTPSSAAAGFPGPRILGSDRKGRPGQTPCALARGTPGVVLLVTPTPHGWKNLVSHINHNTQKASRPAGWNSLGSRGTRERTHQALGLCRRLRSVPGTD